VSANFAKDQAIPVDLLKQWIDESYRAQAPKRLSRGLAPLSLDGPAERPEVLEPARARLVKKRSAPQPKKKKAAKKKG
jgi:hypothetical protein